MSITETIGVALMLVGVVLSVLAAWGVLQFPTALARMHAATKSASLGLALVALGSGFAAESAGLVGIGVLVAVFMFMTAPISGHMLGRSAYVAGQVAGLVHDDLEQRSEPSLRISRPTGSRRISIVRLVLMASVWVLLWRDASPGVWAGGFVVAAVIEIIRRVPEQRVRIKIGGLVSLLGHYIWMVILSNLRVAWEVITPNNDQIQEAIVAVPLRTDSVAASVLVANAISFTPGSLTIDLTEGPLVLYVHVLHFESVATVRADVAKLEDLVVAAVAQPERA